MKRIILILTLYFSNSFGQNSLPDAQNILIGKWKQTGESIDPGDGSEIFSKKNSNKTIEFKANGKVISNQELCRISNETKLTKGTYSIAKKTITPNNCGTNVELVFEIKNGQLTIYYMCKESCGEIYEKLK